MSQGSRYSQQFKEDAVRYRKDYPDLSLKQAAKNLAVSDSALKSWIKIANESGGAKKSHRYSGKLTEAIYTATTDYKRETEQFPKKHCVSVSGILKHLGASQSGYHA